MPSQGISLGLLETRKPATRNHARWRYAAVYDARDRTTSGAQNNQSHIYQHRMAPNPMATTTTCPVSCSRGVRGRFISEGQVARRGVIAVSVPSFPPCRAAMSMRYGRRLQMTGLCAEIANLPKFHDLPVERHSLPAHDALSFKFQGATK